MSPKNSCSGTFGYVLMIPFSTNSSNNDCKIQINGWSRAFSWKRLFIFGVLYLCGSVRSQIFFLLLFSLFAGFSFLFLLFGNFSLLSLIPFNSLKNKTKNIGNFHNFFRDINLQFSASPIHLSLNYQLVSWFLLQLHFFWLHEPFLHHIFELCCELHPYFSKFLNSEK